MERVGRQRDNGVGVCIVFDFLWERGDSFALGAPGGSCGSDKGLDKRKVGLPAVFWGSGGMVGTVVGGSCGLAVR